MHPPELEAHAFGACRDCIASDCAIEHMGGRVPDHPRLGVNWIVGRNAKIGASKEAQHDRPGR